MNGYEDVTDKMIKKLDVKPIEPLYVCKYIKEMEDGDIIIYDENNAKFDKKNLNEDEISTIKRIQRVFGWNIAIIRKINVPEGVKCPDLINLSADELEYWDIKGIYKSQTASSRNNKISHAINEAKGQTKNIILDLNRKDNDLCNDDAVKQLNILFKNSMYNKWLKNVILFGSDDFVRFYRYNKKN